jgi:sortase (surface protein transpeptidase)
MKRQGRRGIAAALAFVGLGLVAAAGALAVSGHASREDARLSVPAQEVRLVTPQFSDVAQALELKIPDRPKRKRRIPVKIQMPNPIRITIPSIGVSAPIIPLGLNSDRTLQVPQSFSVAGWFTKAAEPGEPGPAIIVGHVDSKSGPGVFYRLRALRSGDLIKIDSKGGWTVKYTVTSHLAAPKNHFPTRVVYGRTNKPTLRLITCDGRFNSSTGHYADNYVVFARFAGASDTH